MNEFTTKEKYESGFTPKTSIRLVNTIVNQFSTKNIESSTLSSGHFGHGGFAKTWKKNPVSNKKPGNMIYPKSRIPRFRVKYLRMCKVIVTKTKT